MVIYKTSFLKTAWKFTVPNSMSCGFCWEPLLVIDVVNNPKHHFNPGQLFSCNCRRSKIWTNSVRYPKDLVKYCEGEIFEQHHDPEVYGFCNDTYCPYCWNFLNCLKNGKEINGRNYDVFGCYKCTINNNILNSGEKLGESEGQLYLAQWYKNNQVMWRGKM